MAVEGDRIISVIQLKHEIYEAARDGKVGAIIDRLQDLKECEIISEILDYNTQENGQSTTPLIIAARNGHICVVLALLLMFRANVEQTGTVVIHELAVEGATPLWCAAIIGHLGIVKTLIDYGANVNSKTSTNSTALLAACFGGDFEVVKVLVEHGADVNVLTEKKTSCLSLACYKGHYSVAEYLIQNGANVNQKNVDGWTALHACADQGHTKITNMLLKYGANITTNKDKWTPLMIAAINGMFDTVEYFTERSDCKIEDKIDALEFLGTTFALIERHQDMERAYHYLKKAMEERNKDKNVLDNHILTPFPAYDNWLECRNLSELEAIKQNISALKMECLAKRERILGPGHPAVIKAIAYVGDYFLENHEYTKGLNLWHYALNQHRDTPLYVPLWFPETLDSIIENKNTLELKIAIDALQIFTTKLESIMLQIKANEGDVNVSQKDCEEITMDCVKIVAILLTTYTNEDDLDVIHQHVYQFLKLAPRLLNGFTPLHMCCSAAQHTKYRPLHNVVQFPNHSLCKTFIRCGSKINAMDNENNTPLHTIAKCADSVTDLDSLNEMLSCLIENGAHLDIRNKDNKTAADIANTDVMKNFLMANMEISLKCIAAASVRKQGIEYVGVVSKDLEEFIELH